MTVGLVVDLDDLANFRRLVELGKAVFDCDDDAYLLVLHLLAALDAGGLP